MFDIIRLENFLDYGDEFEVDWNVVDSDEDEDEVLVIVKYGDDDEVRLLFVMYSTTKLR